jgi:hypothetical protein
MTKLELAREIEDGPPLASWRSSGQGGTGYRKGERADKDRKEVRMMSVTGCL